MSTSCNSCREIVSDEMWQALTNRHRVYTHPPRLSSRWRKRWEEFTECLVRDCGYGRSEVDGAEWLGFERLGQPIIVLTVRRQVWYLRLDDFTTSSTAGNIIIDLRWCA